MSTLCGPIDCAVHGILQARILEWIAFPFSRCAIKEKPKLRGKKMLLMCTPEQLTFQNQAHWLLTQKDIQNIILAEPAIDLRILTLQTKLSPLTLEVYRFLVSAAKCWG